MRILSSTQNEGITTLLPREFIKTYGPITLLNVLFVCIAQRIYIMYRNNDSYVKRK